MHCLAAKIAKMTIHLLSKKPLCVCVNIAQEFRDDNKTTSEHISPNNTHSREKEYN